jgi:SAM-dependent methyltransferase
MRVLDMSCGPGRHALEFARRGFQVTGVDLNPSFIAQAKERAEKKGLSVEFVQKDMREFRRENFYDVGLNLFTSFGFFDDPAEDKKVIENFFVSLKPGGFLLVDVKEKETFARDFRPRDWRAEDSTLLLEEREIHTDRRPAVSSPSEENLKLEDSPVHFGGEGI